MLDAEKPVTAKGLLSLLPNAHTRTYPVRAPFTARPDRRNNDCALRCGDRSRCIVKQALWSKRLSQ